MLLVLAMALTMAACGAETGNKPVQVKVGTWKTAQTILPYFYDQFVPENYELEVLPFTTPGDQKAALLAGELDMTGTTQVTAIYAAAAGEPYPSDAVLKGDGRVLSYPYFDDSISTINAGMTVTKDTIKNNPEPVQALVNAHMKAADYLQENQDVWFEKAYEFGTTKEIMGISSQNIERCGDIDEAFIQHTGNLAQKMKELGILNEVPDVDAMFDLSFLENAKK